MLDRMRDTLRVHNFSSHTEKAYIYWVRSYLTYYKGSDITEMALPQVKAFLKYLSMERLASARTLDQAMHAILYLYRNVMHLDAGWLEQYIEERAAKRHKNVLGPSECQALLSHLFGHDWLIAAFIYGSGLRLTEAVRLRVRDVNFQDMKVLVRDEKGEAARVTLLPRKLVEPLHAHLEDRRMVHIKDLADGLGEVVLPSSIKEQGLHAARTWDWQFVFPSAKTVTDLRSDGAVTRFHLEEKSVKRGIEHAAMEAEIYKQVTAETLRNSFAVQLIQQGVEVHIVEALIGQGEMKLAPLDALKTRSPLDRLILH
jgi:site-specific recombinase XerD